MPWRIAAAPCLVLTPGGSTTRGCAGTAANRPDAPGVRRDDGFTGTRRRFGDFFEPENLGTSELLDADGLHEALNSRKKRCQTPFIVSEARRDDASKVKTNCCTNAPSTKTSIEYDPPGSSGATLQKWPMRPSRSRVCSRRRVAEVLGFLARADQLGAA